VLFLRRLCPLAVRFLLGVGVGNGAKTGGIGADGLKIQPAVWTNEKTIVLLKSEGGGGLLKIEESVPSHQNW
jgi:hypothetical protein